MQTVFLVSGWPQIISIFIFLSLFVVLPILALVDLLKKDFEGNNKLLWVIVIVFLNVIGSFLYFTIGRKKAIPRRA
ncbi:PLDc N-terminal domain-containing protein [Robertkochia sediminum]|uniref:PLDc N-terminal domain-containing protein n=1 Tax=Robertkochia sediminum TaxID=2785326 RepID=UPI001932677C|nr:PLD nuclease N-terminal domain-containing protein [Robertkochia sediminum]MBL7471205.1 PLDc_N domain-containing protein [Robertkochia sediminum]